MATQTPSIQTNDQLLRYALRGDGIFSVSSGILFLLAARPVAQFLGIQDFEVFGAVSGANFLLLLGIVLIAYGMVIFYASEQTSISRIIGLIVVELNAAWVVGSVILLLVEALPLTRAGAWSVLIAADVVLTFAIVQYVGLRRMKP